MAKCANCRGPHIAQANAYPRKRATRSEAKGWRSPSPKRRQQGEEPQQPEEPPAAAETGQEGNAGAGVEQAPATGGEAMEE